MSLNFLFSTQARLFDLSARYWAIRALIVYSYYSPVALIQNGGPLDHFLGFWCIVIYGCVFISVFYDVEPIRGQLYGDIVVFLGLKVVIRHILKKFFAYFKLYYFTIKYKIYTNLFGVKKIIKYKFIFWRPFFKKFSYLLNFFKKKK